MFAIAQSLWQALEEHAKRDLTFNPSESYQGIDQLMREIMRVAAEFETWACAHVDFGQLEVVWPYLLADRFGPACLELTGPAGLASFDAVDCLRMALLLRLPVQHDGHLLLPVDEVAPNQVAGSAFRKLRIQTFRQTTDDDPCVPFTVDDDPYDDEGTTVFFALHGIREDDTAEHIADRATYAELYDLACKLAPGVTFPAAPRIPYR